MAAPLDSMPRNVAKEIRPGSIRVVEKKAVLGSSRSHPAQMHTTGGSSERRKFIQTLLPGLFL
ncbi:MAG: hypothetical protein NTZ78_12105 [Candidatus Aureabacteria bacterium]|nr:hypothetical protein [Candidatus Auribacterota bacterium]